MKKLLIGCGVLFLLALGGVGYFAYQLAEPVRAYFAAMERTVDDIQALNTEFPYDAETEGEFMPERFEAALDLRTGWRDPLRELGGTFQSVMEGIFPPPTEIARALEAVSSTFAGMIADLRAARMAPDEFSHHMLTYWAAAASASAGAGDAAALAGDIENYERLSELYAEMREDNDELIPLEERIAGVPEVLVAGARTALARRGAEPPLAEGELVLELLFLQLSDPSVALRLERELPVPEEP